jgi:hypothetical protein
VSLSPLPAPPRFPATFRRNRGPPPDQPPVPQTALHIHKLLGNGGLPITSHQVPVVSDRDRECDSKVLQALLQNEPVVVQLGDVGRWRGWRDWRRADGSLDIDRFVGCFGPMAVSVVAADDGSGGAAGGGGRGPTPPAASVAATSTATSAQYGGEDRLAMSVAEFAARVGWGCSDDSGQPAPDGRGGSASTPRLYIKDWHFLRDVETVRVRVPRH